MPLIQGVRRAIHLKPAGPHHRMDSYLPLRERTIKSIFKAGLFLKWIIASLQIVGGLLLLFISRNIITNMIVFLTQGELIEDPSDLLANSILKFGTHFLLDAKIIIAVYLLIHGIVKFSLLYGLWRNKMMAYPLSAAVFFLVMMYQLYLYYFNHSAWMLLLSIFDALYIYLILHEYALLRKKK
jgi:uncharacterized membrane protein